MIQTIDSAADFLSQQGFQPAAVGLILGTGLSGLEKALRIDKEIPYGHIPGFPVSTVTSHSGSLLTGTISDIRVMAMSGRFHFYEGYSFSRVSFPIKVMHALGMKQLMVSNSAGALNPDFRKGDLMLLTDHINFMPGNPLIGPHDPSNGSRFPDMSAPYDKQLQSLAVAAAAATGIDLKKGVYAAVPGPLLETRAEYRFLRRIGADAVGMSTVPEIITARQSGIACMAVSVLTDECDPDHLEPATLESIIEAAASASPKLVSLFKAVITAMHQK